MNPQDRGFNLAWIGAIKDKEVHAHTMNIDQKLGKAVEQERRPRGVEKEETGERSAHTLGCQMKGGLRRGIASKVERRGNLPNDLSGGQRRRPTPPKKKKKKKHTPQKTQKNKKLSTTLRFCWKKKNSNTGANPWARKGGGKIRKKGTPNSRLGGGMEKTSISENDVKCLLQARLSRGKNEPRDKEEKEDLLRGRE